MSYVRFTVSHCYIGHYVGISMSTWKIHKFGDNFANEVNLPEIFSAQILCT